MDMLIVVDIQNDFCLGGSLPVTGSNSEYIKNLNKIIELALEKGSTIVFSQDWHPINHCSFRENGGSWPPHCIANTWGAEFHSDLFIPEGSEILKKGQNPSKEEYSIYSSDQMMTISNDCNGNIFITGVALEYCVTKTALDAASFITANQKLYLLSPYIRSISTKHDEIEMIYKKLFKKGVLRCKN